MTAKSIGFTIDKAPEGGYRLCQITNMTEGEIKLDIVAYCSTLAEVQNIELQKKSQLFGERAWYPTQGYEPVRPPVSSVFPESSRQPEPPPESGMVDDGTVPNVVRDWEGYGHGLMDRLNSGVRALVPMLFLAGIWLMSMRIA